MTTLRFPMWIGLVAVLGFALSAIADQNELVTSSGTDRVIRVSALEVRRSTDTVEVPTWQTLDDQPVMKIQSRPDYPERALKEGVEAQVWVTALVDASGIVQRAVVKKPSAVGLEHGFEITALEAAMANVFEPATKDGKPMVTWIEYPVEFKIKK